MEILRDLMITIVKDSKEVAAGNFYGEGEAITAIKRTQRILDNYNRHLVNSKLEKELLALRMLQEENEEGTLTKEKIILTSDSRDYLSKKFPTFEPYREGDSIISTDQPPGGDMIVHPGDIIFYNKYNNQKVVIDLDEKRINFQMLFYLQNKEIWGVEHRADASSLATWDDDFIIIPFNELKDFQSFVEENEYGFLSNLYFNVVVPVRTEKINDLDRDPDRHRDFC